MDQRVLVTDSRYSLESTTCRVINTSPTLGLEHPTNIHQAKMTMTETTTVTQTINTMMKKMTERRSEEKTMRERECTYPNTSPPFIMKWIYTLFANNQMRIFMERSMQTMDQHIKCNNITTNGKIN